MNIVITMAGSGERFRRAGFDEPKFMIEAKGQSLFRWSMMSLENFFPLCQRLIFIVRSEDQAGGFITSEMADWPVPEPILVPLSHRTDGQATSALVARDVWDSEKPLLIYNIDTHVKPDFLKPEMVTGGGWIPCFRADGSHWSFVRTDGTGRALEVREKQRISDFASVGLYWFETATLFEWAYAAHFEAGVESGLAERYIAPLYNDLIRAGHEVTMSEIPAAAVVPMGTPEELDRFNAC
jgi:dTDP-glucose pyrophosphorylase